MTTTAAEPAVPAVPAVPAADLNDPVHVDRVESVITRHWADLVRLAALLLRDRTAAEDVVQDAVVKCLRAKPQLRDPEAGLAYVRRAVVNSARTAMRRQTLHLRHQAGVVVHTPGADEGAMAGVERDAVIVALKELPRRQREAIVLRFWADATEKQAAEAMGVSVGSVKSYTSRGLAALTEILEGRI